MSTQTPSLSPRFPSHGCATAGGTIGYREATGERPLVLLHGIGSGAPSWLRQLDQLGGRFRVLAWDAPGYGESQPLPAAQPTAHDYAARLWQWMDALGEQRPLVLVGHSLGALMAAAAAAAQPQRVQRLLLLSPAQGYGRADAAVREAKLRDRLHNLQTYGPAGMAQRRAPAMLSPAATPEQIAEVGATMARVHPAGYTQATHMLANADLAGLLEQVRCPVTVGCGDADGITPPAGCRALAERLHLPYVSLGPVGHACAVEAPGAVSRLIEESAA
ncbi:MULTISPECIES: alpha/beta fold hydrolase [Ramlibacter]|uniref:Alpha/beta fold hydrolase n=1 Tax=Ramlibacter pinisoli TaxID=2682844 RepID=A0A6N8ISM8_9BURK|nr:MULTISPECIES: alpha/beta hydrolase [Ramlibacter]MBA2964964.1 alpha/beta hydrolase [Ramlibacter sp. CGMCC 1.13660]MVQ29929.1 alpha/beta fold hydrolase [Ramlibacter pinisoli]